jgi:hypothetical protein
VSMRERLIKLLKKSWTEAQTFEEILQMALM